MSAASESGKTITAFAPAKINLALHVCGKRADGYHLLDSLVVFADTGDTISVQPSADLTLSITGPFAGQLSEEKNNLALRAANLLRAEGQGAPGATIELEKSLPVASGIGGGSADASTETGLLTCIPLACGNCSGNRPMLGLMGMLPLGPIAFPCSACHRCLLST